MAPYTILAIETSLDDTCAAVTQDDWVISNVIASQTSYHEEFGGTVPDLARRLHQQFLEPTVHRALVQAGIINRNQTKIDHWPLAIGNSLDAIAVTIGPGLAPCLEQGINYARLIANSFKLPLIAVNHLEGHLLSSFAKNAKGNNRLLQPKFPALGFIISGGHTELVLVKNIGQYELLGQTLDDAAGEAYDKVARMLELGYPGGPILAEIAKAGQPKYTLPIPMRDRKDLNFSFSGLKTAALYKLRDLKPKLTRQFCADFAASFQEAALTHLTDRLETAIKIYTPKMLLLGGGVVSNLELRKRARTIGKKYNLSTYIPYHKKLFTDNAAMIGVTAWYQSQQTDFVKGIDSLDRQPNLNFNSPLLPK